MRHRLRFALAGCALLVALLLTTGAFAQAATAPPCPTADKVPLRMFERVLRYHSDITVARNGTLDVAEHLCVWALGEEINHGIYRDIPTDYRDRLRSRYRVRLQVLGASIDGAPAPWRVQHIDNGTRIYVGSESTTLSEGVHAISVHYRVQRALGYFPHHDELYWNVNGTGWDFSIDYISASVHLPGAVPADRLKALGYTGAAGSTTQDLTTTIHADGADYAANGDLAPGENLTIVLQFPTGIVTRPPFSLRARWFLQDNPGVPIGCGGLVLLWLYYLGVWRLIGRDPRSGPLLAVYEPPDGESPALMRCLQIMGYDIRCFSAGILGIAAKGGLKLEEEVDDNYSATSVKGFDTTRLTADEAVLYTTLFADDTTLVFDKRKRETVAAARKAHHKALKDRLRGKYFHTNILFTCIGVAWTLLVWGVAAPQQILFMAFAGGFGWFAQYLSIKTWYTTRNKFGRIALLLMLTGFWIPSLWVVAFLGGMGPVLLCIAMTITNMAFYRWNKARTRVGARLMQRIAGFRWYLVSPRKTNWTRTTGLSPTRIFSAHTCHMPWRLALVMHGPRVLPQPSRPRK